MSEPFFVSAADSVRLDDTLLKQEKDLSAMEKEAEACSSVVTDLDWNRRRACKHNYHEICTSLHLHNFIGSSPAINVVIVGAVEEVPTEVVLT